MDFEANPFSATTKKSIIIHLLFGSFPNDVKAQIHDLRLLTRQSLLLLPLLLSPLSGFAPTFGVKISPDARGGCEKNVMCHDVIQGGATKSYKWYNGITPLIKWPKINMVTRVNYFTPIIGVRGPYL